MLKLSKSRYVDALEYCPRLLWLREHFPDEEIKPDNDKQIADGNKVGVLARQYFKDSVEVEYTRDLSKMIEDTRKYLDEGKEYICEASFSHNNLFCSVDILHVLENNEVEIYEVKATNEVKDYHKSDVSYQAYLLTKCGYVVKKANLMHLNKEYKRSGDIDLKQLFVIEDYTDFAKESFNKVEENIRYIREIADVDIEPVGELVPKCKYCSYFEFCTRKYPKPNALDLGFRYPQKKKIELIDSDIITFDDIYKKGILSGKYLIQVRETLYGNEDYIDKENVKEFLDTLSYPVYHLDFETFQEAIPPYDGIWPYRQVPFQYSLHIQNERCGECIHKEFLGETGKDPRRKIAESLCENIPDDVCVLAYHKSFECTRLKELAEDFPDLREHLMKIEANTKDLEDVFRNVYYYNKEMGGSASIKKVLPALFSNDPTLDYYSLDQIHHGGEAMVAFFDMTEMTEEEEQITRHNLLKYCELDTFAMVKILNKLEKSVM